MPHQPTAAELRAAGGKTLPDIIDFGLHVLFCGINPGLYTAAIGHHFARPGNRFWSTLHFAGFTPRRLMPAEERRLLDFGLGITNVAHRPTTAAAELSQAELLEGGIMLQEKVLRYQPRWLAVLGIDAYRKAFGVPRAAVGPQVQRIGATCVWLLPNPSGLNAHYTPARFADVFRELRLAAEEPAS
ncbi:MAG TPA: G/U mismatch-specific DNA glycosylase [Candidatus Saccharimonadales bacterium]|nr:G/U mismatch-specific DNA glycosylase [Candidatus Saccharimonadales bacterium]